MSKKIEIHLNIEGGLCVDSLMADESLDLMSSLHDLLVRAAADDVEAQKEIVEQYENVAFVAAYGVYPKPDRARLAGQFALGQVLLAIRKGQVPDNFKAYLRRSAVNAAITLRRRDGKLVHLDDLPGNVAEAVVAAPDRPLASIPSAGPPATLGALAVRPSSFACAHEVFEAQARERPDAVAVVHGSASVSYAALDRRAGQIAWALIEAGVRPDDAVVLRLPRGLEMVAAVLGVWKAGAAYVPSHSEEPPARVAALVADSGARRVLSTRGVGDGLPGVLFVEDLDGPAASPGRRAGAAHRAYVLYTSGSTGRPKGVEVTHRGLVRLLESVRERPGLAPGEVVLSLTTLAFDISVMELTMPWAVGGRVVVAPEGTGADAEALAALIARSGATLVQATPTTWRLLAASDRKSVV